MSNTEDLSTFLVRNKLVSGTKLAGLLKAWQEQRAAGTPMPLHALAFSTDTVSPSDLAKALENGNLKLSACAASGRSQVFGGETPGVCAESGESYVVVDLSAAMLAEASPVAQMFAEGDKIGRYTITRLIGVGSAGEVYQGHDPMADRQVAIKLLRLTSETSAQRFIREGRVLANLHHPNIVALYDLNMEADPRYLVMEYVEGRELEEMIEGEFSMSEAIEIVRMCAAGVAFAHSKGVIHRDLKPANVMIDKDGTAKVTDFGLAKAETSDELTIMGETIGTPMYMAPEQIKGELDVIGPPTDVYALGVLLFRVLAGEVPFTGRSAPEIFQKALLDDFPSVRQRNPEVSMALDRLIAKACAKTPDERHPTATEFEAELTTALTTPDSTVKRLFTSVRSLWKKD